VPLGDGPGSHSLTDATGFEYPLEGRKTRFGIPTRGAFGCGAFRNPADRVARIYREEIELRTADFSVVAFAIFSAGYGPGNYAPFAEAFSRD
jgi:hypothetical protein